MIVTKKWIAAGSTATLLAGGLFLGAPMASAAPGDAACLQASVQFNAALSAAGIDVGFVSQLELATAAVLAAAENLEVVSQAALTSEPAAAAEAQIPITEEALSGKEKAVIGAEAVLAQAEAAALAANPAADPAADPNADGAVISAQQALLAAQQDRDAAAAAYDAAIAAYETAVYTDAVKDAEGDFVEASDKAGVLLGEINSDEAVAAELLVLFKAFLAACDAGAIGVEPVTPVVVPVPVAPVVTPVVPVTVAPVTVAPVTVAPATGTGSGVAAPTGTNKGLNVQTAVATEDDSPAVALLAALLAVGVAVPVATAARMRRLARAQR
ncbi:hypothetical protein [Arthrobacter sedimenti]|uniref:hypothetical protein n=1 Tax=Arthrobacter sedimenti TaxID=2694931 RepID=UPI000B562BAB|nr:hypothetical protein [Arthrobacter sedimenti]OUM43412.1 hypothetical protein B8W73_05760 [Arthrobacter agilis]